MSETPYLSIDLSDGEKIIPVILRKFKWPLEDVVKIRNRKKVIENKCV